MKLEMRNVKWRLINVTKPFRALCMLFAYAHHVCFVIETEHGMVIMCKYKCHDMRMIEIVMIMLYLIVVNERETCVRICALCEIEM